MWHTTFNNVRLDGFAAVLLPKPYDAQGLAGALAAVLAAAPKLSRQPEANSTL